MALPGYIGWLRQYVGTARLLVPGASACIRDGEGQVLLQRRSDNGLWSFPGGSIEPGENAEQAAIREVREEVGLEVQPTGLIGIYTMPDFTITYPNGDQVQYFTAFFHCRVTGGKLLSESEESLETRFFAQHELPQTFPCCAAKARDAFAWDGGRAFFR